MSDQQENKSCTEICSKRLRTLRKKLNKIEKYENEDPSSLDSDQLLAIQRKDTLVSCIKELEDVQSLLIQFEAAQEKKLKEIEIEKEVILKQAVSENALKIQKEATAFFEYGLKVNFALITLLPGAVHTVQFTPDQYQALISLSSLVNSGTPSSATIEIYKQLYENSETTIFPGFSYADMNLLLQTLLDPPSPPKFGVFEKASVVEDPEEPLLQVAPAVEETFSTPIKFINEQEEEQAKQKPHRSRWRRKKSKEDDKKVEKNTERRKKDADIPAQDSSDVNKSNETTEKPKMFQGKEKEKFDRVNYKPRSEKKPFFKKQEGDKKEGEKGEKRKFYRPRKVAPKEPVMVPAQ